MQTSRRTLFDTFTAVGAFAVIDDGEVIDDVNGVVRASLFAFFTPDTGVGAGFTGKGTFLFVVAHYDGLGVLRQD